MKKIVGIFLAIALNLLAVFFVACNVPTENTEPFTVSDYCVEEGSEIDLSDLGLPKGISLSTDSQNVAINGLTISGLQIGEAEITATAGTQSDIFTVSVVAPYELSCNDIYMVSGEMLDPNTLVANPTGFPLSYELIAGTSVMVSTSGKWRALNAGISTIRCYIPKGKQILITVHVVDQVIISAENMTLHVGDQQDIYATDNIGDGQYSYEIVSGREFVSLVDNRVTAKAEGQATIRISVKSGASILIKVEVLKSEELPHYDITAAPIEIAVGDGADLQFSVQPATENIGILLLAGEEYISLDDRLYTVKGVAEGEAQIKIFSTENPSCYTVLTVTVLSNLKPIPDGYYKISEELYVNKKPGLYRETIDVIYFTPYRDAEIYYTVNSSVPTTASAKFPGYVRVSERTGNQLSDTPMMHSVDAALTWLGEPNSNRNTHMNYVNNYQNKNSYPMISLATVFRVIVVRNGETIAQTTGTYLVESSDYYEDYPIISLSMPFNDWFDGVGSDSDANGLGSGLYNNVTQEIVKRLNLEFFDGDNGFSVNSQVKIGGGWSKGWAQRTMHLNFNKDENGVKQDAIEFSVFGNNILGDDGESLLDTFTRFRLHNSGSDHDGANNSAVINDVLIHELTKGVTNVSTTEYRPCIVYLNGEYWGYYAIREHYSDVFYASNYGVKKGDVQYIDYAGGYVVEDGDPIETTAFLDEMTNYLQTQNFALEEVYDTFVQTYVDIDSFIDLLLIEAYVDNWDFMGNSNNFRMWRVNRYVEGNPYTDGRLRYSLHDVDMCLATGYASNNRLADLGSKYITTNTTSSYTNYLMTKKLMCSEKFRTALYDRLYYIGNTVFAYNRVSAKIEELLAELSPLWGDSATRWAWNMNMTSIRNVVNNRILPFIRNRYTWFDQTSRDILGIIDESNDDAYNQEGATSFTCDHYFEGNGSQVAYQIRNISYEDFELSYTHINNGIYVVNASYQYHLKFITDLSDPNNNNYVMRVLKGAASQVWLDKIGNSNPYTANMNLGYGAHKYKIIKQGSNMKVYVDGALALDRTVPASSVVGIDVYQHNSNGKYRNFCIKPL